MTNRVGQQLGHYRLEKLLGSGGFADVYLGQHIHLVAKQAAIKILHLSNVDVKKFQEEAETTEKLVHPHIVRLLDYAIEEDTPFLVLDFAPGGSLRKRHRKGSQLPLETVVAYINEIAPALQYAHDQNILHRDIKPDNMLVGRQGELLLSDFGIAVLSQTGRTSLEGSYGIGGTAYYMAPETFRGKVEKASDQYSLAVVVYEWLCGTPPFTEGNPIQLGYQHTHEEVPPLRAKLPSLAPSVEAVVMRALAKDPKERFSSVREFAEKFTQASSGTPTLMLSTERVTTSIDDVGSGTKVDEVKQAPSIDAPQYRSVKLDNESGLSEWSSDGQRIAFTWNAMVAVWDANTGQRLATYTGHKGGVRAIAWSPDGQRIASASDDMTVQVWDANTGQPLVTYTSGPGEVVAWSPDGQRIASARSGMVEVWDASTGRYLVTYPGHQQSVVKVIAWSPDGQRIASARSGMVEVWDASTGQHFITYPGHKESGVEVIAWSPDGQRIASVSDKTVQIWDASTQQHLITYQHSTYYQELRIRALTWSPDGKYIGLDDGWVVRVLDASTGRELFYFSREWERRELSTAIAWTPDGRHITLVSGGRMEIWDTAVGLQPLTYSGHKGGVRVIAWSPNGQRIASASDDMTVQVWDANTGQWSEPHLPALVHIK